MISQPSSNLSKIWHTLCRVELYWLILLFFNLGLISSVCAQGKYQDSLKKSLVQLTAAEDSSIVLLKLVKSNLQSNQDTAFKYLDILKKVNLEGTVKSGKLLQLEAQLWKKRKDFGKSSSMYTLCINEAKDFEQLGSCHFGLADNYLKQGALDLAIEHLLDAIEIFSDLNLKGKLSSSYNKLGRCFDEAGYYQRAITAYHKALKIQYESGNMKGIMQFEKNLADAFLRTGAEQDAKDHYLISYSVARKEKAKYMIHALHLDFAEHYLREEQLDSAYYYADQAYKFYDIQKKNYPSMINSRFVMGDILLQQQKIDRAIREYNSALQLGLERKRTYQIIEANRKLSKAFETKEDERNAMYFLKRATTMNDSVIHLESQQRILTLNEAYESEKKDKKIVNLNNQNAIQKLELSRSKLQTLFAAFGVFAAGLVAFLLYRSLRVKRESELLLQEKNDIISSALADKELLLKEIHHRVKNNLQIISSLLSLQSEYINDDSALVAINEGRNRVRSMALIHQNLYKEDNLSGISVKSYLEKLVGGLFDTYNLNSELIQLKLDIEDINLDVDTVVPLGLIANEVISNALKHAFPKGRIGEINVSLKKMNSRLVFRVQDNGVGMDPKVINDDIDTFGFQMIQAFKDKMEAELEVESTGGTTISLVFDELK